MKTNTNRVQEFLQEMADKAAATAKKMAALELSVWNSKHEDDLKKYHGFTDATVAARKAELVLLSTT